MSLRRYLIVLALTVSGAVSAQQSADIALSDNMARLTYTSPSLGALGAEESHWNGTMLFTDHDVFLGALGFNVMGETGSGSPGLSAGLGVRGYAISTRHDDIGAVTLGGQVYYAPPPLPRLKLGAEANYAPDITTFRDARSLFDGKAYVGYEVARGSVVDIGYRYLNANLDHGSPHTLDHGVYVGAILTF